MKSFQCLVNGQNFLLDWNGKSQKLGFYKTVFVNSPDSKQAELDAVQMIKSGELKDLVLNEKKDPPMIYVTEISEIHPSEEDRNIKGHTFYQEKKWWQFWK